MVYQPIKIILFACVEDSRIQSNVLEDILKQAGANNYIEMVDKDNNFSNILLTLENKLLNVDAVILNLYLNNISDLNYIGQINAFNQNKVILVISDKDDDNLLQAAIAAGADDYLITSEITPKSLRRSLLRAVEQRSSKSSKFLSKNEAQLRAIFERSSIGIGLLDMNARIIDVNPALCDILGYNYEEICFKQLVDFICEEEITAETRLNYQLFTNSQERFEMERQFLHKDGRLVWAHLNVSLVNTTTNDASFFLAMVEDVTERKRTELKLRESKEAAEAGSKAKSAFLATMSHELRTPLNAIMGLSQLLQQEVVGTLNEKQHEYINCIYTSGEHLLALINDILDLSKVEAGREELMLVSLSISDIVRNVISTVLESAIIKKLQLVNNIEAGLETCIADERRLKQMLLNLLTNAIKFTPEGAVSLEVKQVEHGIAFIVTDTGIGIEPSNFQSLFEPFRQLDNQLNRQYEGTGLGLALTRKLARLHGGDLTVESTLGVGSRFTLLLPAQPHKSNVQNGSVSDVTSESDSLDKDYVYLNTSSGQAVKRILLVEDDEHTAILMQDYLQTIGYEVELMLTAERFITRVHIFKPNLILLDVHLPGDVNGLDLLISLKRQKGLQEIPVVVMTPMGMGDRERFLQAGAIDCLSKPIGIFQLESVLVKYLS